MEPAKLFTDIHTFLKQLLRVKKKNNGLVIDFTEIKKTVGDLVISKLDHMSLNDIITQPTAENILEWIWNELYKPFEEKGADLYELKLFEGPNSYAVYRGGKDFE